MYDNKFFEEKIEYEWQKVNNLSQIKDILNVYLGKYYDENADKEKWFNDIKDLAEEFGFAREVKEYKKEPDKWKGHVGDISTIIRVALTGRHNTPDLYEIMRVLGSQSIEKRINKIRK